MLLVEHHADLIFDICDRVTVLNLGKVLAPGTPAEIRSHREVVSAYLGAVNRCWRSSGLSAGYGKIGVLHGVDMTVGAGRGRGAARPERRRQDNVVLPAPFGPSSATTSPTPTVRSMPLSTPILP